MGSTTSRILVRFHGAGSGVDDLTWAQRDVWDLMRRTGRTMNIGGALPLPAGETVEGLERLLRFLVSRHQALRTRLRLVVDGPPLQVVEEDGEVPLEIVDIADTDDAAEVTEALRVRYQTTPFDPVAEWPVRMAAVRQRGVLTHVVVMYYHLAVDGFGLQELVRDLAHMDPATGEATGPVAGLPPLEQVRQQRTPAARRQSNKSLRYWEKLLRTIPPRRFRDRAADPGEPPIWEINCTSPAMLLAARSIADRTRVDTGPVLLAAAAVTLARVTGINPSVIQVLVSNRFRPGLGESVSNVRQFGLCVIDVADCTFDEVVLRAWNASMGAYLHGYYDTGDHQALLARVSRERGEDIDISCYANDRRNEAREQTPGPLATEEQLRAALPLTNLRWGIREATYDGAFYLHIEDVPEALEFAIFGDTRLLPPSDLEACARGLEAVVVEAAFDPATFTGVRSFPAEV